jgi:hypothetical protein
LKEKLLTDITVLKNEDDVEYGKRDLEDFVLLFVLCLAGASD